MTKNFWRKNMPKTYLPSQINFREIPTLDFVGFDVAILENGDLKIIEANRSPQFATYFQKTNQNPVLNLH